VGDREADRPVGARDDLPGLGREVHRRLGGKGGAGDGHREEGVKKAHDAFSHGLLWHRFCSFRRMEEHAMTTTTLESATHRLSAGLLPELDQEMAATRTCLERLPEDKLDWRPHPKSWTLGELSAFMAILPTWVTTTIALDSLDLAGTPQTGKPARSRAALLESFDNHVAAAREALRDATDEHLMGPWTLLKGGKTLLTQPRSAILRGFALNHLIHHRGQLTVYLRLLDVPVPAIYGPSADEGAW
jgi:uncharacterized damage-inducible protein DinB